MTRLRIFAALACSALALPAVADTRLAIGFFPDLDVNPISRSRFEVIEANTAGPRDFWCAAANYVIDDLRINTGRLYIDTARGPAQTAPGRKGVVFTTEAPSNPKTSYSMSVRQENVGFSVAHAHSQCSTAHDFFD